MTAAEQQAFVVYQQLYLLRFFYILRLYQIHKALGLRNSLEKEGGTDAGLLGKIALTEKDPTGHFVEEAKNWFRGKGWNTNDEVQAKSTPAERTFTDEQGNTVTKWAVEKGVQHKTKYEKLVVGNAKLDWQQKEGSTSCNAVVCAFLANVKGRGASNNRSSKEVLSDMREGGATGEGDTVLTKDMQDVARIVGKRTDTKMNYENSPSKFEKTLIDQLQSGNAVGIRMPGIPHSLAVYGYENTPEGKLRFLVHDPHPYYKEQQYFSPERRETYRMDAKGNEERTWPGGKVDFLFHFK